MEPLELMCPHCGERYGQSNIKGGLTPTHDFPIPCRRVCPGSKQYPRSIYDKRLLWKDEVDALTAGGTA
jgi:hypothetical protein